MADEPENLILQHLRAIRERVDLIGERQIETMQRIGNLEVHVGNLTVQFANLSVRVDRIDARLERVERRLGLLDA